MANDNRWQSESPKWIKSMGNGNHLGKQRFFSSLFKCLSLFKTFLLLCLMSHFTKNIVDILTSLQFTVTFHTPIQFLAPGPYLPCYLPLTIVFLFTGILCLHSFPPGLKHMHTYFYRDEIGLKLASNTTWKGA